MIINNIYMSHALDWYSMPEQFCGLRLGLKQKMKFVQFIHFDCYTFLMEDIVGNSFLLSKQRQLKGVIYRLVTLR